MHCGTRHHRRLPIWCGPPARPPVNSPQDCPAENSSATTGFPPAGRARAALDWTRNALLLRHISTAGIGRSSTSSQRSRAARIPIGPRLTRAWRQPGFVSKVDRLTRSAAFLSRLLEAGVDVRFVDIPQIEGATDRFLLQQMVAVAELEAGMISARTKADGAK